MKPEVFARFKATMHIPNFGSIGYKISNIDEVREFVNRFGPSNNSPRRVAILRESCVVNMDKKRNNVSLFDKDRYIDGHPIIATETDEKFEFILPILMYPNDVAEYLIKQYGNKFNFDPKKFDPKIPLFFNVIEHTSVGMRISEFSAPAHIKWHNVHCEPLSEKVAVTDKNLNQLWPENTGKIPVGLVEIFNTNAR